MLRNTNRYSVWLRAVITAAVCLFMHKGISSASQNQLSPPSRVAPIKGVEKDGNAYMVTENTQVKPEEKSEKDNPAKNGRNTQNREVPRQ